MTDNREAAPLARPLTGRVAWVTGASRGVGRAVALRLARAGAVVVAGARTTEAIEQLAKIAAADGAEVHALALDVASPESVAAFAAAAMAKAAPPAILINNAGLGLFQEIDTMTPADFSQQIDVNLKGPWYMMREAVPHMRRLGGGHIINISSVSGRVAFHRGSGYAASKAGLNMMGECLQFELRPLGIHLTTIAPGSVDTAFHGAALPNAHTRNQDWMLEPDTLADAVLHILTQPENALTNYYEIRPLRTSS